jgi:hypothetical protein
MRGRFFSFTSNSLREIDQPEKKNTFLLPEADCTKLPLTFYPLGTICSIRLNLTFNSTVLIIFTALFNL